MPPPTMRTGSTACGDLPEMLQAVCDYYKRRFGVEGLT